MPNFFIVIIARAANAHATPLWSQCRWRRGIIIVLAGNYLKDLRSYFSILVTIALDRLRLRATMAGIEGRLDPRRFVHVHRSYPVNLDYLAEITPLDTGDARFDMRGCIIVSCSRRLQPGTSL